MKFKLEVQGEYSVSLWERICNKVFHAALSTYARDLNEADEFAQCRDSQSFAHVVRNGRFLASRNLGLPLAPEEFFSHTHF
jgi:hypothetical protein